MEIVFQKIILNFFVKHKRFSESTSCTDPRKSSAGDIEKVVQGKTSFKFVLLNVFKSVLHTWDKTL